MWTRFLQRFPQLNHISWTLLRVVSGIMFAFHGAQKVFGFMTTNPPPAIGTQIWCGGMIELIAGLAIALGVWFTCMTILASGTMAVAYAQFHWKFQFDGNFFPAINKGELSLLYCLLFFYFAFHGPGPWALRLRRSSKAAN